MQLEFNFEPDTVKLGIRRFNRTGRRLVMGLTGMEELFWRSRDRINVVYSPNYTGSRRIPTGCYHVIGMLKMSIVHDTAEYLVEPSPGFEYNWDSY